MFYKINKFLKRIFDLLVCVPAVLILLPVWIAIAIAIKCDSKGPVFFGQTEEQRMVAFLKCINFGQWLSMRKVWEQDCLITRMIRE